MRTVANRCVTEGNGFELPVPREIASGLEGSVGLRSIDRWDGVIIRAVIGSAKVQLFRRREELSLTAGTEGADSLGE